MYSKKILAVNVHPNLDGNHSTGDISPSFANKIIMEALHEHVNTHNLIERYPDQKFDLEYERELLSGYDTILLIGPIYWYSLPSIAKKWLDEVFIYGWAYGTKGNALKGKEIQLVLTSGSTIEEYSKQNIGNTLDELFSHYQRSFEYCKMKCLDIKFIGGINSESKSKAPESLKDNIRDFAQQLLQEHQ